ncbi:MAG: SMC family ATPase, partial [Planctomycetota bacterium]
ERGLKLPLILDETLGNSDERRAEQIIDASIQICRGGRQVFYLTAQHDEVGKWRVMLARHADVPSRVIDLAEIRQFSEAERVPPMEVQPQPQAEVPPPGDLDWLAYGRLLGVPSLDPLGQVGGVHLWYLVDDLQTLHRLLRHGINRWGQLQTLAAYGHDASLGADSPVYRRAEAAARLIEAACRLRRVGRGRPVDRQALVDCPAVSGTFLDRVCDLAAEVSGDAAQLIARLEAGDIKGFRTEKRSELEQYLAEQGHLDQREALSADAVRQQVLPLVFSDLDAGLLSQQRFEQVLAVICGT